jgi:hypothetical protein
MKVEFKLVAVCLEGRVLQKHRSLDLHRPDSRFYTVHVRCERAWQKLSRVFSAVRQNLSRVFAADFGKKRCEQLGTGGHAAVSTPRLWQCFLGKKF